MCAMSQTHLQLRQSSGFVGSFVGSAHEANPMCIIIVA